MPEPNSPTEDRRRPPRPPWLHPGQMQPPASPRPGPAYDQTGTHNGPPEPPTSRPPARTDQDNYPRQSDGLIGDPVAPDLPQISGRRNPRPELFDIARPRDPGQPGDCPHEPRSHPSQRSDVPGGHRLADLDSEPKPATVRPTADYHRGTVPQESSGFRPATQQDAPARNPQAPAEATAESTRTPSPSGANRIPPLGSNRIPPIAAAAVPTSRRVMRGEVSPIPLPHEASAQRPFAASVDDTTAEPLPPTQQSALPSPRAPSQPPGCPPAKLAPPAGWPPGVPPLRPPAPPVAPPPHDWQRRRADGAASPRPPMPPPPQGHPRPAFWQPAPLHELKVADRRSHAPHSGWRRAVHQATRGYVNPGDSRKDRARQDLLALTSQPLIGDFRIAVISVKGGVGKTTTTLGLGSALAMSRRDRVIALDANPDRGTLAERVGDASTGSTVRDLLTDPNINRYADIRSHTRMAASRLEVLASEQDPAAANVFSEADYRRTIEILCHYYNVILTDCGTGITHSAMAGVLDLAHSIVLVSTLAIDAVRSASATLDWLMQHGHSGLAHEGHVVLSAVRPGAPTLKVDKAHELFVARCRSIHVIPFDPHLAKGAHVDFGLLKPATQQAYLELAGAVAQKFPPMDADHRRL